MGEVRKINPYDFSTVGIDEAIEVPKEVKNFIGKCPSVVYDDMTSEEARRLRLENLSILNEIINDVTVSATTRVQAIQAREKILKDLMGNGAGINQRSIAEIRTLLSDDDDDSDDIDNKEDDEAGFVDKNNEYFSRGNTSINEIKQKMLDDSEDD